MAVSNIRILLKFVWHSSFDKKSNTTNKQPIHVQRQQQQQLLNSTVFPMHNMQFCWLDFRRIFFKLRIVILETWKRDKRDIGIIIRRNWDGHFRKYNRHFCKLKLPFECKLSIWYSVRCYFFFSKLLFNLVKWWKLNFQLIYSFPSFFPLLTFEGQFKRDCRSWTFKQKSKMAAQMMPP